MKNYKVVEDQYITADDFRDALRSGLYDRRKGWISFSKTYSLYKVLADIIGLDTKHFDPSICVSTNLMRVTIEGIEDHEINGLFDFERSLDQLISDELTGVTKHTIPFHHVADIIEENTLYLRFPKITKK